MKCRNCKNNSLREENGEQYTWCEVSADNLDIDAERKCAAFKQATKADQMRAMTDEELAGFLEKVGGCGPNFDLNYCDSRKTCDDLCWLQWLKQEATFNAETETTICKDGGDAD